MLARMLYILCEGHLCTYSILDVGYKSLTDSEI